MPPGHNLRIMTMVELEWNVKFISSSVGAKGFRPSVLVEIVVVVVLAYIMRRPSKCRPVAVLSQSRFLNNQAPRTHKADQAQNMAYSPKKASLVKCRIDFV